MEGKFNMYPTKKQILAQLPTIKESTLKIVLAWKDGLWSQLKTKEEPDKLEALQALLLTLAASYDKPLIGVHVTNRDSSHYKPEKKTIHLKNPQSIISALHELAHHLYGSSELKACKWSIALFKRTFPISYSQLEWQGHMLVRKKL